MISVSLKMAEDKDKVHLATLHTTCKIGCDACCHGPRWIPILEALERVKHLELSTESRGRLKEAATQDMKVTPGVSSLARIPCVFLRGRACSIYEHRPLSCRTQWVTSPKEHCDPQRFGEGVATVDAPASTALVSSLLKKGKASGLNYPSLPLSVAFYLAFEVKEGRLTQNKINSGLVALVGGDS